MFGIITREISIEWAERDEAVTRLENRKACCYPDRFDLCYPDRDEWIRIYNGENSFYIGYHEEGEHAWIGILRVPLNQFEVQQLIRFIFKQRQKVNRISFRMTYCNPDDCWPHVKKKESRFWYLVLSKTFEALTERVSGTFRRRMKYEYRRLEKAAGEIGIPCIPREQVSEEIMKQYFLFKQKKYGIARKQYTADEYLDRQQNSCTHIYTLETKKGELLAVMLTSELKNSANLVNMAYNDTWEKYSPGKMLYYKVIERFIEKDIQYFYLGTGNYEYKHHFQAIETPYWTGDFFRML